MPSADPPSVVHSLAVSQVPEKPSIKITFCMKNIISKSRKFLRSTCLLQSELFINLSGWKRRRACTGRWEMWQWRKAKTGLKKYNGHLKYLDLTSWNTAPGCCPVCYSEFFTWNYRISALFILHQNQWKSKSKKETFSDIRFGNLIYGAQKDSPMVWMVPEWPHLDINIDKELLKNIN